MVDHLSKTPADETGSQNLIRVRGVTMGYAGNTVLEGVDLDIPSQGIVGIMGPSGAGKTTLMRMLAGQRNPSPAFWCKGQVRRVGGKVGIADQCGSDTGSCALPLLAQKDRLYAGTVLENLLTGVVIKGSTDDQRHRIAQRLLEPLGLWNLMKQHLRQPVLSLSLAEHKKLLIARMLAAAPSCLFVDEPLSDVAVADEAAMIDFLRVIGNARSVVVVLHNKLQARRLCDYICLVSGGRVVEAGRAKQFFTQPATVCGREFLQSGSSWLPSADPNGGTRGNTPVDPAQMRDSTRLPWNKAPILREFRWVIEGRLGGAQLPGLLGDDDEDLRALKLLGVAHLVSLTEVPFDQSRLAVHGIDAEHMPIVDMGTPHPAAAERVCRKVARWIENDEPTVFHCRAGLGRTGTMLACALVFRGTGPGRAIQEVRRANPRYIQNDAQLRFVSEFHSRLSMRSGSGDEAVRSTESFRESIVENE